jgi:glycosyltransferase involved in cell wall biosynthesis
MKKLPETKGQNPKLLPEQPPISIVIPCFNYGHYLAECIQSALNQTYPNLEVIVIDDESTDNTSDVAKQFSKVKYLRIKHRGNKTPAHALNVGIQISVGDFIIFLGADDKLDSQYVTKCLELFNCKTSGNKKKVGFIWTGYQSFGDKNVTDLPYVEKLTKWNYDHCGGQLGSMLVPKPVYLQVGGYDESLPQYEDLDWVIRACKKGYVGFSVKEPLHNYRFHGFSVNSNPNEKANRDALFRKYPSYRIMRATRKNLNRGKNYLSYFPVYATAFYKKIRQRKNRTC